MKCIGCGCYPQNGDEVYVWSIGPGPGGGDWFCFECAKDAELLLCINCGTYFSKDDLPAGGAVSCVSCGASGSDVEPARFD